MEKRRRRLRHARRLQPPRGRRGVGGARCTPRSGPDGAVWVADWYNFISQHNPTPPGYSNGPGNAYETSMRDRHRGRIYRVVPKGDAGNRRTPALVRSGQVAGPIGSGDDGGTRRGALVRQHAVATARPAPARRAWPAGRGARARRAHAQHVGRRDGPRTAVHCTPSGRWTASAPCRTSRASAGRAVVAALKHPAAGVRKAAATVAGAPRPGGGQAIVDAGLLRDTDLHTRLAAILALADARAIRRHREGALRGQPRAGQLRRSLAQPGAVRRRASPSRALPHAVSRRSRPPCRQLRCRCALRLGNNRPDWRMPDAAAIAAAWKDMEVPGNWEAKGLPNFDGVVWFTRTLRCAVAGAHETQFRPHRPGRRDLGERPVGAGAAARPGGAQRRCRSSPCPTRPLRAGSNTLTLRIQNYRGDGGFVSPPDLLYRRTRRRTAVAGRDVEVTRRAADQRRDPVCQARRTRRASRAGDDDRDVGPQPRPPPAPRWPSRTSRSR